MSREETTTKKVQREETFSVYHWSLPSTIFQALTCKQSANDGDGECDKDAEQLISGLLLCRSPETLNN